jgi:hypothetical protein
MEFISVRTPEGAGLFSPSQDYRNKAVVTTVDANMLRHVQENVTRCPAVCIQIGGGRFEHTL